MREPEDQDAYLDLSVGIEPMALQEEYVRLPADLAYWNNRYAEVYKYWLERKQVVERLSAERKAELRATMNATGKTRVTIGEIEDALQLEPDFQQAISKQIAAESEKVRLYGVLDAIRSKRDMLISLGAHIRMEMQNDPMIREQSRTSREVREGRDPR